MPCINCCFSNSPTGPFHKITFASERIDFIDIKLSGAISNSGLKNDIELVDLILNKAGVVMVPGTPFGAPGYVRLSFACSMEELKDAIQRLKEVLT